MDKYIRLKKNQEKTEVYEVRVTSDTYLRSSLAYVARLFEDKHEKVLIKGMGFVISKALSLATLVRHRFAGLHQIVDFGTLEIVDEYAPIEEGLDNVIIKKKVPNIIVTLSLKPLDKNHPGYSAPLDEKEVLPYEPFGARRGGSGGRRFRGRRPRQGDYPYREDERENEEGPRPRGRGRYPRRFRRPRRAPRYDREEYYEREDTGRTYEREEYDYPRRPRRARNWRGPRRPPRYSEERYPEYEETRQPRYSEQEEYSRPRGRGRRPRRYRDSY